MKTASAYASLLDEEKNFLINIAEEVAMLIASPDKWATASEKRDYFQEQLTEFAKKWKTFRVAYEAHCKGKWQPSMGKPSNPLGIIWPYIYGLGRGRDLLERRELSDHELPIWGQDVRWILGGYVLLAVIHDRVLSHLPSITKEFLPKELSQQVWQDLVTGVDIDGERRGVIWRRKDKIESFLSSVRTDIEKHFARKEAVSGDKAGNEKVSGGNAGDTKQPTLETTKQKAKSVRDLVFIGYSHKDKKWLDDLQTHLKPYVRNGSVKAWSDKQIVPSSKWFPEIKAALASTKVAVLLVTSNFLASDFIHEHELGPLLKEAEKGKVSILWIPVRACAYKETPLKDYQTAIEPDKPLAQMKAERDKAWVKICEEIKKTASSSLA